MTQRSRRDFTESEILLAIRLHNVDLVSWQGVAERLGRGQSSLESTVCRYRRGLWQHGKRVVRNARIAAEMERLVEVEGVVSPSEIGRAVGINRDAASRWLSNIGLDKAARVELAGSRAQR